MPFRSPSFCRGPGGRIVDAAGRLRYNRNSGKTEPLSTTVRHTGRALFKRIITISLAAVAFVGSNSLQAEQSPAEQLADEMFTSQISAARNTPSLKDDLLVAEQLLIAAYDETFSADLRLALVNRSLDLTVRMGKGQGERLAMQALGLIDEMQPLDEARRAQVKKQLAVARLSRARQDREKSDVLRRLARQAVLAQLAFTQATAGDLSKAVEADQSLDLARSLARKYSLAGFERRILEADKEFRRARRHAGRLSALLDKLQTAQRDRDATAARTAKVTLGSLHLDYEGDVRSAAKYLAGTSDPREEIVAAAAKFVETGTAEESTFLKAVVGLTRIAENTREPARSNLAGIALRMCKGYLATDRPKADTTKAGLLLDRVEKMMSVKALHDFRKRLVDTYGAIAGKLKVLDDENVRLTYDFSNPGQLADWAAGSGDWKVARGTMVSKTSAQAYNKLRFRADRPFKIVFEGAAGNSLECWVRAYRWRPATLQRMDRFILRSSMAHMRAMGVSRTDSRFKLSRKKWNQFKISYDGKGGFAWSINDKEVYAHKEKAGANVGGSLQVELRVTASKQQSAAFRSIMMEGAVLPKPGWVPPARMQPDMNKQKNPKRESNDSQPPKAGL